jgi:hypothetical protein
MNMLSRLRYLLAEGFEVASLAAYDGTADVANASILYVVRDEHGERRLRSEIFAVTPEEMKQCSRLFLSALSNARKTEE